MTEPIILARYRSPARRPSPPGAGTPVGPRAADGRRPPAGAEPLWRDALGRHLRRLRRERGETLTQTATRAGLSPQYLSEVERGIKEPSSEMVAAVAGALDVTLLDLTLAVAGDLRAATGAATTSGSRGAYLLAA